MADSSNAPISIWRTGCDLQRTMRRDERRFVYILRSEDAARHYIGIASDPATRLAWHDSGPCGYTLCASTVEDRGVDRVPYGATGTPFRTLSEIRLWTRLRKAAFRRWPRRLARFSPLDAG
jgi:predicted GIY-YIG superfamily endonuclease